MGWRAARPVGSHGRLRRGTPAAEGRGAGLCLLLLAGRHCRFIDRPAWRCRRPIPRHLPALARRSRPARIDTALLAAGFRQSAGDCRAARLDRSGRQSVPEWVGRFRRRHLGAQGCAVILPSRLRGRRCCFRREPGGTRRGFAAFDAHPAPAANATGPARARLSPSPARCPRRRPPSCKARSCADAGSPAARRRRRAEPRVPTAGRPTSPRISAVRSLDSAP